MSPAALLVQLLDLDGVLDAALLGPSGEPLEPLLRAQLLAPLQETLKAYLTSDRVLAELLGAETPSQTMLEFGPEMVVLTRSAQLSGEPCCVVTLCAARDLDEVRTGLEQLLAEAAQVSISG